VVGGSNPLTPIESQLRKNVNQLTKSQLQAQADLLTKFLKSRREGLSPRTIEFYQSCLSRFARAYPITSEGINTFLSNLSCGNGKLNHYRAITVFVHWLMRERHLKDNPLTMVDKPKPGKRLLPSVTDKEVAVLLNAADNLRDKCIISLLFDSGMRLTELTNIKADDIDWSTYTITIIGKGNKQRRAPFTMSTAKMLQSYLDGNHHEGNIWNMGRYGIQTMLKRLSKGTGIKCNPHSFRRGMACDLHRKGLSTLDIMHLGGWEDLDMVLKYTRSVTFEDCLKHYRKVNN
jgi:integrase/recombinase XerC